MKDRLKQLRKALRLTQQELADHIGASNKLVSTWEKGVATIPQTRVYQICNEFNVRREWLETGVGEMFDTAKEEEKRDKRAAAFGRVLRDIVAPLPDDLKDLCIATARDAVDKIFPEDEETTDAPPESSDETTTDCEGVKERLKELRRALSEKAGRKVTQRDVAERLGVDYRLVGNWESTRAIPKTRIYQICNEYGVNRDWLERGVGEMFDPTRRELSNAEVFRETIDELLSSLPEDKRALCMKAAEEMLEELLPKAERRRDANEQNVDFHEMTVALRQAADLAKGDDA